MLLVYIDRTSFQLTRPSLAWVNAVDGGQRRPRPSSESKHSNALNEVLMLVILRSRPGVNRSSHQGIGTWGLMMGDRGVPEFCTNIALQHQEATLFYFKGTVYAEERTDH